MQRLAQPTKADFPSQREVQLVGNLLKTRCRQVAN